MEKYSVYSDFDIEKHKQTFTNYLEVVIKERKIIMNPEINIPELGAPHFSGHIGINVDCCLCERPMWGSGYDCFSVHWTDGHYTVGQKPIISDMEKWKELS